MRQPSNNGDARLHNPFGELLVTELLGSVCKDYFGSQSRIAAMIHRVR
jgi:hypothetical protein